MYKKKNNAPLYIAVAVAVLVIVAIVVLRTVKEGRDTRRNELQTEETEAGTEAAKHDVLLYKTSAGTIEFEEQWLKSDSDSESVLSIQADTLVTMLVTPKQGKELESVDIVDYDFNNINNFLRETSTDAIRVNFVMPDNDIIVNFNFEDIETELPVLPENVEYEPDTETKTETEAQTESPYGLTLHGVTADVIMSYNGQFDDKEFLQQIGDALHMDSARSEYQGVTDVTVSREAYQGEKDSDKVYYYVYFNDDPDWKVLSTYYLKDRAYVFTELAEPETEPSLTPQGNTTASNNISSSGSVSTAVPSSGGYSGVETKTSVTSFDILQVSTTFLSYIGDKDEFYQKAFEYVLGKGMNGEIVGTMSSYEIDPEEQVATIVIRLNTGGSITGKYNRNDNSYSFTGL